LELAPDNPRVLWMDGAHFLFRPPSMGGDLERAIAAYTRMAESAARAGAQDPASPLPEWGRPEAPMSLAYAELRRGEAADLARAQAWADEALALRPDWAYVRDTLQGEIADARRARRARATGTTP
jgi:hypothetical protein